MIDTVAAGGEINAPVVQRVFWAIVENLVVIALLFGGAPWWRCRRWRSRPAYIADTLRAILDGHPKSRIEGLMPWR